MIALSHSISPKTARPWQAHETSFAVCRRAHQIAPLKGRPHDLLMARFGRRASSRVRVADHIGDSKP